MTATGVIVEYNPFHNGHLHHLEEARKQTNADCIIAVMSGHFLQRGEPASYDKWTRTKMALHHGADLVIELPYRFATSSAEDFAKGGVHLLNAIMCDSISFGSEEGDIMPFIRTYDLLERHNTLFQQNIHKEIKNGLSYAKALHNAFENLKNHEETYIDLTEPNNILGYHYVEQIKKAHLSIQPTTIQRTGAGYHEEADHSKQIASATGIRKLIQEGQPLTSIKQFVPEKTFFEMSQKEMISWENAWPYLRFILLRENAQSLTTYMDVSEGIEHVFLKAIRETTTFVQFMERIKSKRYTWTRLQRMLTHILTGYTKTMHAANPLPSYIRLLGMNATGQRHLSTYKKQITLPIISRVAAFENEMLAQDIRATDLYALLQNEKIGKDYVTPPIRLLK